MRVTAFRAQFNDGLGSSAMKLDPVRLSLATAIAFGVVWTVCTALVVALPAMSNVAAGGMMHFMGPPNMLVTPTGFLFGLVGWSIAAGVTSGLLALIYNALGNKAAK